jgi:hypothetical protein
VTDNGNDNGRKLLDFIKRISSNAYYVLSISFLIVGVIIGQVTWQLRHDARLAELEHRVQAIDERGTRSMAERFGAVNDRLNTVAITEASHDTEFANQIGDLRKQLDALDGTRARLDELDHRLSTLQDNTRELAKMLLVPRNKEPQP